MTDDTVAGGGGDTIGGGGADTIAGGQDTTAGGSGGDTIAGGAQPQIWPDDWRDRLAGADDKHKKVLARYSTPENVAKAYLSLRQQLDSGEYRRVALPDGADEEAIKSYRKAWGVPDVPEGYIGDRQFSDDDKAALASFTKLAHEKHLPAAAVNVAFDWYASFMEEARAGQAELDNLKKQEAEDELRAEWGNEYRAINNATMNLLKSEGLESIVEARDAMGVRLADNPGFRKWLSQVADAMNPALRISGGSEASMATVESEIASIKAMMGDPSSAYHRDGGKTQARYLELLTARERMAARAA